jgi:hypothetical protein
MKHAESSVLLLALVFAARQMPSGHGLKLIADSSRGGVLSGTVTKGPFSPVVRRGQFEHPAGVAGAQIEITTAGGQAFGSVKTDSKGAFRVELPTGIYQIAMPSQYGAMFTKDLPATIRIVDGQEKRLDIHLDTGIR